VSVRPGDVVQLEGGKAKRVFLDNLEHLLEEGFLPVVFGDVMMDKKKGFTIWSTEQVLGLIAKKLDGVARVIHCGEKDGFLVDGEVVEKIAIDNFDEISSFRCITIHPISFIAVPIEFESDFKSLLNDRAQQVDFR